ncbi:MAG: DUF4147 domain-containing protein [Candidatus Micrarchaeota archaeon]
MILIKQKEALIRNGASPAHRKLMLDCLEHTANSLLPDVLLKGKLSFVGKTLIVEKEKFEIGGKIFVIGAGKAGGTMAETIEKIIPVEKGIVSLPRGTINGFSCKKIELIEAGHPYPDEGSMRAAKEMISLSKEVREEDLLICLISGGGSSLLALPDEGISMEEKSAIVKAVMNAGANIEELNSVRKSLSAIKGGKLAMHFKKAKIVNIILSDVLENSISTVASGPTVLDRYAYAHAKDILKKYGFWDQEKNYCKVIERGIMVGRLPLTLEKSQPEIDDFVIGDNALAVKIASSYLERNGYAVEKYFNVTGTARDRGREFALILNRGKCFVAGGETTVKVKANGIGGRNQEFAMGAAQFLKKGTLVSMGTDGIDGISNAAGAIVDNETKEKAKRKGLSIPEYLEYNDSNHFFEEIGDGLIVTGPSGTNVCDLMIGLV